MVKAELRLWRSASSTKVIKQESFIITEGRTADVDC